MRVFPRLQDLAPAKALIDELSPGVPMIAKIEHPAALRNMDAILDEVGAVMVVSNAARVALFFFFSLSSLLFILFQGCTMAARGYSRGSRGFLEDW